MVDRWQIQAATEYSNTISLVAGQRYSLKMEYYENAGRASAKLRWSGPGVAKEIIPASHLFTETVNTVPAAPTGLVAKLATPTSIALTWNNVANETAYKIERRRDGTTD